MHNEIPKKSLASVTGFNCWIFPCLLLYFLASGKKAKKPQRIINTDPALRLTGYAKHLEMTKSSPWTKLKWQFPIR